MDGELRTPVMSFSTRAAVRVALGAGAIGAGVIHLAFAPTHLDEYVPLGAGFVVAGVLQILWGLALPFHESRLLLRVGALGSLLFIGVYLMSRTVGLPLGPNAFQPEGFAAADLLCCALEVPVAFGALALSRRPGALRGRIGLRFAAAFVLSLGFVGTATAYAATAPAHEHEHVACPSAPVLTGRLDARGVDTGVTSYFACKLEHEHDGHHH
jgi:hypothetical protein